VSSDLLIQSNKSDALGQTKEPEKNSTGKSEGVFTTIDVPGASYPVASGINHRGDIVGYYWTGGAWHGFVMGR